MSFGRKTGNKRLKTKTRGPPGDSVWPFCWFLDIFCWFVQTFQLLWGWCLICKTPPIKFEHDCAIRRPYNVLQSYVERSLHPHFSKYCKSDFNTMLHVWTKRAIAYCPGISMYIFSLDTWRHSSRFLTPHAPRKHFQFFCLWNAYGRLSRCWDRHNLVLVLNLKIYLVSNTLVANDNFMSLNALEKKLAQFYVLKCLA